MVNNFVDVSEAFQEWDELLTVTRPGSSDYDTGGVWIEATATTPSVIGHVQSASFSDVQMLSEGYRSVETVKIFTTSELQSEEINGQEKADIITYEGFKWRVIKQAKRFIGGYYKSLAIRFEVA